MAPVPFARGIDSLGSRRDNLVWPEAAADAKLQWLMAGGAK
jgi:hypothetical protein